MSRSEDAFSGACLPPLPERQQKLTDLRRVFLDHVILTLRSFLPSEAEFMYDDLELVRPHFGTA